MRKPLKLAEARRLVVETDLTKSQIAEVVGVFRATLCRALTEETAS